MGDEKTEEKVVEEDKEEQPSEPSESQETQEDKTPATPLDKLKNSPLNVLSNTGVNPEVLKDNKILYGAIAFIVIILLAIISIHPFLNEEEKPAEKKIEKTAQADTPKPEPVAEKPKTPEPEKAPEKPKPKAVTKPAPVTPAPMISWEKAQQRIQRELEARKKVNNQKGTATPPPPTIPVMPQPVAPVESSNWQEIKNMFTNLNHKIKQVVFREPLLTPEKPVAAIETVIEPQHNWQDVSHTLNTLNQQSAQVLDEFRDISSAQK